jgi:hypothetical protein
LIGSLGVDQLNALRILPRDWPSRFRSQGVEHQAPAHADLAVNAPDRQFDAGRLRRFAPGQHMLVDAVDQGAVQIEEEGQRVGAAGFRHGHIIFPAWLAC